MRTRNARISRHRTRVANIALTSSTSVGADVSTTAARTVDDSDYGCHFFNKSERFSSRRKLGIGCVLRFDIVVAGCYVPKSRIVLFNINVICAHAARYTHIFITSVRTHMLPWPRPLSKIKSCVKCTLLVCQQLTVCDSQLHRIARPPSSQRVYLKHKECIMLCAAQHQTP